MTRTLFALLVLVALAAYSATNVTVTSDAGSVFGQSGDTSGSIDIELGRDLIIAVLADDVAQRNDVARQIVTILRQSPLLESTVFGPEPPSAEFQDWIWEKRFQLAPPEEGDFDVSEMARNLDAAKAFFSNIDSMAIGDRLLLDPTGSYRRLIGQLARPDDGLSVVDGVWQSSDDTAAIVHATFSDRPFEAKEVHALTVSLRSVSEARNASVHFLGARTIAAETTLFNYRSAARASLIAAALLIAWLIWSLRSIASVAFVFLPLVIGIGVAFLVVQLMFGYVHVIATGFGGALLGLALDYPIHIIGHSKSARPKAFRLVILGSATTSIAFLAMVGSGVPALVQTGVFVASGLTVAALASVILSAPDTQKIHGIPLGNLVWRLPFKPIIEIVLAIGGLTFVLNTNQEVPITIFAPPSSVSNDITLVAEMLALPSGRYVVAVEGDDLNDLLSNEQELAPILDDAIKDGSLTSYTMLAQVLLSTRPYLPAPDAYLALAEGALRRAGMSVGFATNQLEAYTRSRLSPAIRYEDLLGFPETRAIAGRLRVTEDGWREHVSLTLPDGGSVPDFDVNAPFAEIVDLAAPVRQALDDIRHQVTIWLLVGLCAGVGVLALGLGDWRAAGRIFRTSCAMIGVTASFLVATFGTLSIFHIVAMALVVGIGVDYGMFFKDMKDGTGDNPASTSVALCASSTLIAFTVLSFSDVQVLYQIGVTVVVGLFVLLVLTLAQMKETT